MGIFTAIKIVFCGMFGISSSKNHGESIDKISPITLVVAILLILVLLIIAIATLVSLIIN